MSLFVYENEVNQIGEFGIGLLEGEGYPQLVAGIEHHGQILVAQIRLATLAGSDRVDYIWIETHNDYEALVRHLDSGPGSLSFFAVGREALKYFKEQR